MSDKIISNVYETRDYDKFHFIKGNRGLNTTTYLKLLESMKEEVLCIPILVNKEFGIIDGQHRYTAAKAIGAPVYYHIQDEYGIEQVKKANMIGSNWEKKDFLNMYVEQENEVYECVNSIIEEYGIGITTLLKILGTYQGKALPMISKSFEEGTLSLDNISDVYDFLDSLMMFRDIIDFKYYNSDMFVKAYLHLYQFPDFKEETLKRKIKNRSAIFEKKKSRDEYILLLCGIYNVKLTKGKIYYDPVRKVLYTED